MACLSSFCMMEFVSFDNDELRLRLIRSNLRQGEAHELATREIVGRSSILVIGSPTSTTLGFFLPQSTTSLNRELEERSIKHTLRTWTGWLRDMGIISFGGMFTGLFDQVIPARYICTSKIESILGIPSKTHSQTSATAFVHKAEAARQLLSGSSPHSIAGILGVSSLSEQFIDWLSDTHESDWPKLQVPLFELTSPIEAKASCLKIGLAFWRSARWEDDFVIGRMAHVTVDDRGWIEFQEYPIDRYGHRWSPPTNILDIKSRDSVYQTTDDLRLTKLFSGISKLIEMVLHSLIRVVESEESSQELIDSHDKATIEEFVEQIMLDIKLELSAINHLVLENICPSNNAPSVSISQYLFSDADPIRQRRRTEILENFPLLIVEASKSASHKMEEIIDNGLPIFRNIAKQYNCPVWVARRAQEVSRGLGDSVLQDKIDLATLISILTYLGPHTQPPSESALIGLFNIFKLELHLCRKDSYFDWQREILFRSAGRQAQREGWRITSDTLLNIEQNIGLYSLMDYWDVMIENIADVIVRHHKHAGQKDIGSFFISILKEWLIDTPLQQMSNSAGRWMALLMNVAQMQHQTHTDKLLPQTPLFGWHSLIENRVQIRPLLTRDELIAEAGDMRHCIAAYNTAASSYQILIASLTYELTGQRATLSLLPLRDGSWRRQELKGYANAVIETGSVIDRAANELVDFLNQQRESLNAEILDSYLTQAKNKSELLEHFRNGRPIINGLPSYLLNSVMPCFPGNGTIDERILRAHSRFLKKSLMGRDSI